MSNKSGNFKGEINISEMKGDKMNELEKRIEALENQTTVIRGKNFHINSNGDSCFTVVK
ncbi:hypothetical protein [Proteus mirabilis]|uniref:hypothetical protein n=1 Tax=Proteus mirabilis TaxID=584 RepID=UPI00163C20B3|nr:hypothetical protein [Proteus mirabilis]EKU0760794.1 hypothetical protein [Proteus mirabilis]EKX9206398.1 hypothetical protein [Proteus mirabilis]MBG2764909.1 hypothetical protein [Proteus mirabilis]MDF7234282.1 hypothetical protein [Proteus mirabilis]HCZ8407759.1 hypothetical protein [Proteus mirabilis]